jgi:hypothetical protein
MLAAAGIALSRSAELVSDVITHCAATVCIHEPTLLVNWADQNRRNACESNGVQPLPDAASPRSRPRSTAGTEPRSVDIGSSFPVDAALALDVARQLSGAPPARFAMGR